MNVIFLPTSRKALPTFQIFCSVGVQIAQAVVHFAHIQVQAKEKGRFEEGLRCFCVGISPRKGCVTAEQGLGVLLWAK